MPGWSSRVRSERRLLGPAVLAAIGLLVAGCGSADDAVTVINDDGSSTSSTESEPSTSSTGSTDSDDGTTGTSAVTGSDTETTEPEDGSTTTGADGADAGLAVALSTEGLTRVVASSGSTTQLPFGIAKDEVLRGLEAALGPPDAEDEGIAECSNGQASVVTWSETLALDFDGSDRFLSWILRPGSELTDFTGVGLGSTLDELQATWAVTVSETTLGYEATVDGADAGLGALLTGPEPTDTITDLWAGQICAFR
jgi:hypothetical protein